MLLSWHPKEHIGTVLTIIHCLVSHWRIVYSFWAIFNSEFSWSIVLKFLLRNKTLNSAFFIFFNNELTLPSLPYWWRITSDEVWWCNCSDVILFSEIRRAEWAVRGKWLLINILLIFFLWANVPHLVLNARLELFVLSEIKLRAREPFMENCHHWDKHFWWDVRVKVNVVVQSEVGHLSECALEKSFDLFLFLCSLDIIHCLALWSHVKSFLFLTDCHRVCLLIHIFSRALASWMLTQFAS